MKMLKLFLSLIATTLLVSASFGQTRTNLTEANADCSGIIDLLAGDTVFGPTTAPVGPGKTLEISGEKNSLTSFEKEHNTVWYRFRVQSDGQLLFDVIPLNTNDDYDFILYRYSGKNFCSEVTNKTLNPVRTCISRNDPAQGSRTGLKQGVDDEFIHSGPGASWCKSLPVKKGEIYVLVLDNVYPSGKGHTLKMRISKTVTPAPDPMVEQAPEPIPAKKTKLVIKIIDKETKRPLKANLEIVDKRNADGPPLHSGDSVDHQEVLLDLSTTVLVKAEAANYFGAIKEFKTSTTAGTTTLTIALDRLVAGKNVVFENILFYGDQARFLPESTPSLQILSKTMLQNPNLVIEVEGHVNCPSMMESCETQTMQNFNNRLSDDRAKAVVDYLVSKGISAERMTYKGYGATRMVYPDARSEDQMKQNRRVEIVIISNE